MSNLTNEMLLEEIWKEIEEQDLKGELEKEINEIVYMTGNHADDNREDILCIIAEDRFESRSYW